ncbi:MAG: YlbF family regulator [Clostridia bacterium]|nr:YlbF family regulator [Clostridia bacterium]
MNVYDKAHELSTAIKESGEYKEYSELREKVRQNTELDAMLKDFQEKQITAQAKMMAGETLDDDTVNTIQNLYQIIAKDPTAGEYLQAEMRFSVMIKDVYEILGETISLE